MPSWDVHKQMFKLPNGTFLGVFSDLSSKLVVFMWKSMVSIAVGRGRLGSAVRMQLSNEKNPYYFPLYWLVNRDPCNGLL